MCPHTECLHRRNDPLRTPLNHWGVHRLGHVVVARANGQEITRVLSERVGARPAGPALVHLFDKDIGQRLN